MFDPDKAPTLESQEDAIDIAEGALEGESISEEIGDHFRTTAEGGFPEDISSLEEAFFAEKGINPEEVTRV